MPQTAPVISALDRLPEIRRPGAARSLPDLPHFYYHTHFFELLGAISGRYAHCLSPDHLKFLSTLYALPFPAQCLYARLAGRKGLIFDTAKFKYEEIPHMERQLARLGQCGLITSISEPELPAFFSGLTKADLTGLLKRKTNSDLFKKSWKKDRLVEIAAAHLTLIDIDIADRFIVQTGNEDLEYLYFLYFGRVETSLEKFTLHDLGIRKVPDFKADYSSRFDSWDDAQSAYFYARGVRAAKYGPDERIAELIDTVDDWPMPQSGTSEQDRGRLIYALGRLSERLGDTDTALTLYGRADCAKCNERNIRIRYARGDKDWCEARLTQIIDDPGSDAELDFAEDFYARKFGKKRTSEITDILRGGDVIRIDDHFRGSPEQAVKNHFASQGFEVFLTENTVWRMLFGLLFWNELFGGDNADVFSPFDRTPRALKDGSFYPRYEEQIEDRLSRLKDLTSTRTTLLKIFTQKHGTPNGIFPWSQPVFEQAQIIAAHAPSDASAQILRQMAKEYRQTRDGFPDLMRVKNGEVSFVEVKSEGDVIQRNQLTRIKQLRRAGFTAEIACVEWIADSEQVYVVVDVETTGGRAGAHRITEIGAVKIQGGQIIDEFQTLINPERSIPPFITGLTGITQDMVKDAPTFEDIAEAFAEFMSDAIFAAHNVNFDFSFIKSEFGRLNRRFSAPKICTCASMRRHYPGYKSYSLKNLCKAFDIKLDQHHRALCDARAAAELLFLVNDKRAVN